MLHKGTLLHRVSEQSFHRSILRGVGDDTYRRDTSACVHSKHFTLVRQAGSHSHFKNNLMLLLLLSDVEEPRCIVRVNSGVGRGRKYTDGAALFIWAVLRRECMGLKIASPFHLQLPPARHTHTVRACSLPSCPFKADGTLAPT